MLLLDFIIGLKGPGNFPLGIYLLVVVGMYLPLLTLVAASLFVWLLKIFWITHVQIPILIWHFTIKAFTQRGVSYRAIVEQLREEYGMRNNE